MGQTSANMEQGKVEQGLAPLDEAMVGVTAGELSPLITGLNYCSVIEGCQQVDALGGAREWTAELAQWCDAHTAALGPSPTPAPSSCTARRSCSSTVRGGTP